MSETHPALRIRALKKTYSNGVEALKGVDLDVQSGEFFALLGPNGAGKSTLIGIVSSLVNKSSGSVSVFGHDLVGERTAAMRQIGLVPQEINFNQFERPLEIVVNQAGYYGVPRAAALQRAQELLEQLKLWDKRNERGRDLSGGMKRRLMIARAMVHKPRLLILDEPTAGVDIEIRRSMWRFIEQINEQGTTVILTTHYLEEAEQLCKRVAIINHGEIVKNTSVRELLTQLDVETFVLDLNRKIESLPKVDGLCIRQRDASTIEVDVPKNTGLNHLFEVLTAAGMEVQSMRNKANRLEELFMRLVEEAND